VVVSYVECEGCGQKGYHMEENRGQGVILDRQKWYGCQKERETEVVRPEKGKVQQSSAQAGVLEGTAKEESRQREIRQTFKMLREVWLNIRIEKCSGKLSQKGYQQEKSGIMP